MTKAIRHMTPAVFLLLLALSVLWGASFYFVEIALHDLPPLTLVFCRVLTAAIVLHLILRLRKLAFPWEGRWFGAFLVMGLLNNVVPFSMIFWGQTQIGASLAAILNGTTPIFTLLVAHFATADEKLSGLKILGAVLGFTGVTVMVGYEALSGLTDNVVAQLAVVLAAFSYGLSGSWGRRFASQQPLVSATGQVTGSTLIMIPIVLLVDKPWTLAMPGHETVLAVLGLGVVSTALAYVLFYRILAAAGATNLMLVTLLIPVTAVTLGTWRLGEVLHPEHWVGTALIALALVMIDGRLPRKLMGRA